MPSIHRLSTLSLATLILAAAPFAGCAPDSTQEVVLDEEYEEEAVTEAASAIQATNLALGKPATQSTTAVGGVASRAVDGNTDGNWGNGSVTHTADPGWWQVDLESVQLVGDVVLFNRTDCCAERLQSFDLLVSDDGIAWQAFPHPGVAGPQVTFAVNRTARFVKVQANNGMYALSLAEVQVFAGQTADMYPRGAASLPTCSPGLELDAGLCYPPCAPGYHGVGPVCWPDAQSYGRGAGTVPISVCGADQELDAGLCYPTCAPGFDGVGPVCWQICPAEYADTGAFCDRAGQIIPSNNTACPWYDACGVTHAPGCSVCPPGYINDGCTCRIDPHVFAKASYGRGAGTVPSSACGAGQQLDAGLCYPTCAPGYHGVGPVCWPDAEPYGRGAGTIPNGCAAGRVLDAGLCYPACNPGYHGVGPVCWSDAVTPASIAAAACASLHEPMLTDLAGWTGQTHTFGFGAGIAAGLSAGVELGVAYGPGGEYGCYVTTCVGATPAEVSIGAWASFGMVTSFGGGDSIVTSAGLSVEIPETPLSVGGALGIETSTSGEYQGISVSASLSAGYSPVPFVSFGVQQCHTDLLDVTALVPGN